MTSTQSKTRTVSIAVHGRRTNNLPPVGNPTTTDRSSTEATALTGVSLPACGDNPELVDSAFKRSVQSGLTGSAVTREEWLQDAVEALGRQAFSPAGYPLPPIKVTIGFPSEKGVSKKRRSLGQCWPRQASDDGLNQIFLNPTLTSAEKFVEVLAHELVHAVDDCKSGHKGAFSTICKSIGLTECTPASASAGAELKALINDLCSDLGPLPHATLHPLDQERKQNTRLLKVECSCGYTCRITAKWVEFGLPVCPFGTKMATTGHRQTQVNDNPFTVANLEKRASNLPVEA